MSDYYITGVDGSGKTFYLKKVEDFLKDKNYKIKHIWLRSPKILSKPLMLFCRVIGLTKYNYIEGIKYGSHNFYHSKIISLIFPFLQFFDFKLRLCFLNLKLKDQEIVLYDRYSLDTLADLMVDTHRLNLHKTWVGKQFINLIPKNTKIIILFVKEDVIRRRKIDTKYDPNLGLKIEVYNVLAKDLNLVSIDNNRESEFVFHHILRKFDIE